MKKITLLVASILLVGNIAKASEIIINADVENRMGQNFDEPISFVERGIEFFVFPNGDFDFNTRPQDSQGDYFYRRANGRVTTTVQARGNINYGVLIQHDSFGRVRRVGNTFINYDNRDRVNRIGTVYMKYNRFTLTQIGGMTLVYNYRGDIINTIGSIKGRSNQGFVYSTYNNNHYNDYTSSSNYYYRSQDNENKQEEIKERK